ncbi:hypothetical protein FRC08_004120 [Ceratobasidium sp. 394]|nr:hypothetical protein FRC08_004120 [Ceratobasidium sp. 394]
MSPMGDQDHLAPPDFANAMDARMQNHLTPTTSSMLAVLNDTFPTSLDASASAFHNSAYDGMQFGQSSQSDLIAPLATHHNVPFSDFGGPSNFDMPAFPQDAIPHPPSHSGSPEPSGEPVKDEA